MDIHTVNADGTSEANLTHHSGNAWLPVWSPDGSAIAFEADWDGPSDIFVMNADGSGTRKITRSAGIHGSPAWSPDGKKVAFQSKRSGQLDIYVASSDGSGGEVNLTRNPADDRRPVWSPDGGSILFESDRDGEGCLYKVTASGGGATRLTPASGVAGGAAFAPGGSIIVYQFHKGPSHANLDPKLYSMAADGSSSSLIDDGPTDITQVPSFASDGNLAFASARAGTWDVYVLTPRKPPAARLTAGPGSSLRPSFSPDARKLAYQADRTGKMEVWVFEHATRGEKQATSGGGPNGTPAWRPR